MTFYERHGMNCEEFYLTHKENWEVYSEMILLPMKTKLKKEKKIKALSRTKLVKYLDTVFSLYIRWKDSKDGLCKCYTCGKIAPVKEMQNGHYISRSHFGLRWSEYNCKVQCYRCNVLLKGNYPIYSIKLMKELGLEEIEEMEQRKDCKWTLIEIRETIKYYVNILEIMRVEIPSGIIKDLKNNLI